MTNGAAFAAALERKALDYRAAATWHHDQEEPQLAFVYIAASLALAGLAAVLAESQEADA